MTRISITSAAFDAIAATLPLGTAAFEPEVDASGERLIWLETVVVNRLRRHARAGRVLLRRHPNDASPQGGAEDKSPSGRGAPPVLARQRFA